MNNNEFLFNKTICVVIPCYNVSGTIGKVLENIPDYINHIVCIDDASTDDTKTRINEYKTRDHRIKLILHTLNQGVGGAIGSGYEWARNNDVDVSVVMAGDGQMDPEDLPAIIGPVASGRVDYAKGNRFFYPNVLQKMPLIRLIGSIVLSFLTKIASGYWRVSDSQCGYTAISNKVLATIDPTKIYKRYGMPNDLLVKLNIYDFSVEDVPANPIYNVGGKSYIVVRKQIFTISFLLMRLFALRMITKYVYRNFHPLVLMYFYGIPAFFFGFLTGSTILIIDIVINFVDLNISIGYGWMILIALLIISGYFSIVIAMFMDMEYNRDLNKR